MVYSNPHIFLGGLDTRPCSVTYSCLAVDGVLPVRGDSSGVAFGVVSLHGDFSGLDGGGL